MTTIQARPDPVDLAGRPHGGMWHKTFALRYMRDQPDAKAIVRGSWDYEIVDALRPAPQDIEALALTGIATNVCVEATMRDALYRDYRALLIEDACNANGPDFVRQATVFNVEFVLGWVSDTKAWCAAFA